MRLRGYSIRTGKLTFIGLGFTCAIIIIGAPGQWHYLVSYQAFVQVPKGQHNIEILKRPMLSLVNSQH
jgi:hypothetical protein